MATLARLKDAEIENDQLINADDLDAEFDQLISGHNDHETRLDDIESNATTLSGVKTFSSIPILPASDPTTDNQAARKAYVDAAVGNGGSYRSKDMAPAVYASASTFTVAWFSAQATTGSGNIKKTTSTTVNIATSGLNGLDTGSEANNTWYYLYAITDGTTPGLILSATNEAASGNITLPSGYTIKTQLPFAVRNDGSGNFLKWIHYPLIGVIEYDLPISLANLASNTTNLISATTLATLYTNLDASAFIPPISQRGCFAYQWNYGATASHFLRKDGSSTDDFGRQTTSGGVLSQSDGTWMPTSASQIIEYKAGHASTYLVCAVRSYQVTEVN